jgi:hypothetical protein
VTRAVTSILVSYIKFIYTSSPFKRFNVTKSGPVQVVVQKCFHNLSEYFLTDHEESVLRKGLNFTVEYPQFDLDIACAVESVIPKLPQILGNEFRWNVRYSM